jgi:hypothetical protein
MNTMQASFTTIPSMSPFLSITIKVTLTIILQLSLKDIWTRYGYGPLVWTSCFYFYAGGLSH